MLEKATFAAGCFWGVENSFLQFPGVVETRVGYTGGHTENPTYREVCGGNSGHHEAVEVIFDTEKTTYKDIIKKFWHIHDPTTRNRQGPDVGEQYHSVVFYHSEEQKKIAEETKRELKESGVYKTAIATDIEPATIFHEAEEYHQKYIQKQGGGVCSV